MELYVPHHMFNTLGYVIVVQSSTRNPSKLDRRIETFLEDFGEKIEAFLKDTEEKEFVKNLNAVIAKKMEKPLNLNTLEIVNYQNIFN